MTTLEAVQALIPIVALLALAGVLAVLAGAPSLTAGLDRLKLLLNTVGLVVVVVVGPVGLALLVWGVAEHRKDLIYISLIPMVIAGATYRAITRRHRTWWGVLFGADDGRETWCSFWQETLRLWGLRRDDDFKAREAACGAHERAPSSANANTLSFSLNLPAGDDALAPLIKFAAHRLDTGKITVFPNALTFAVTRADVSQGAQHLRAFRQELSVRRADGGPLKLRARSDLPFLELANARRAADGSYDIAVALTPAHLAKGEVAGSISVETGGPGAPVLTVPVAATVT